MTHDTDPAGESADTTDITFADLESVAADARMAIELELLTADAAESVQHALTDFGDVEDAVADHSDDCHSEGFVVSPPTLALQWLQHAAERFAKHMRAEGWVQASDLRLGDWVVVDHFTEGQIVRLIDGGDVGRLLIVEDADGDPQEVTPHPGDWFEVIERDDLQAGRWSGEYPVAKIGAVPVDSGRVLLVDPGNLPDELVEALTSPNEHGVTVAAVRSTIGDGWFRADVYRTHPA